MINFITLEIKGFLSIKDLVIHLNKSGLNIIKAKNGTGKTTIFSALSWVLYGKTLKKDNDPTPYTWLQGRNYKGTKVEVTFTKGNNEYTIIRCHGYKKKVYGAKGKKRLIILENGKQVFSERNKEDAKKFIVELLGYSHSLFLNSVIFGQKLKRIIQETGPEKKKVFEDAFQVSYINKAKSFAEKERDLVKEELALINKDNELLESKLSSISASISDIRKAKKKFKEEKNTEILILRKSIEKCRKKIGELNGGTPKLLGDKELEKIRADIKALEAKNSEISLFIATSDQGIRELLRVEFTIEDKKGKVKELESKIRELKLILAKPIVKCPRCGSVLDKRAGKKEKSRIKSEIEAISKNIEELFSELDHLYSEKKDGKDLEKQVEEKKAIRASNNSCLTLLNSKLQNNLKLQNALVTYTTEINAHKLALKLVKKRKLKLSTKKLRKEQQTLIDKQKPLLERLSLKSKELSNYDWLIKVPLSNSGLKAFIFNHMLGLVNERLRDYSKVVGFQVNFGIDLESTKKDFVTSITKGGKEMLYDSLSGGEQQLVDVMIAFSIQDVTGLDKPVNLLMLDEVFESLDEDNVELVGEMIVEKSQGKCLWLVTHLPSFNPSNANTLNLVKKNGYTQVAE